MSTKGKKGKTSKKGKTTAEKKEKAPEFKYGVDNLAEDLGIAPASVRVALRKAGIEKGGRAYGWNSQSDYKSVLTQLKPKKKAKNDDE